MKAHGPTALSRPASWLAAVLSLAAALILQGCSQPDAPAGPIPTPTPQPEPTPVTVPVAETDASADIDPGIFPDRILFGQSAAFSGPAQELGKNMKLGIEAAFQEINRDGGVFGRRLELLSLDDAYEPEAAISNTKQLIEDEAVFALIGAVGTPTSRSALPVARDAEVPYIAPFTGAGFLRLQEWDNVLNLRASYNQETEEMVKQLVDVLGLSRIGIVYQDDSYGQAGYHGTVTALAKRNKKPAAIGVYPRNTTAVKTGLVDLQRGNPEAVIIIGAYEPVANLIAWARRIGMDAVFVNISFVGSNALAGELKRDGEGVFVTQVVPFPTDASLPITAAYHQALADFAPEAEPGFVSFEGYLAGRMTVEALRRCGIEVTRECFLWAFKFGTTMDLGGFSLVFGPWDNQGSDAVFLTVIGPDGQYLPVDSFQVADP